MLTDQHIFDMISLWRGLTTSFRRIRRSLFTLWDERLKRRVVSIHCFGRSNHQAQFGFILGDSSDSSYSRSANLHQLLCRVRGLNLIQTLSRFADLIPCHFDTCEKRLFHETLHPGLSLILDILSILSLLLLLAEPLQVSTEDYLFVLWCVTHERFDLWISHNNNK